MSISLLPLPATQPRSPSAAADGDITGLLQGWRDDGHDAERLVRAIYPRLEQIAAHELRREGPNQSLQISDLTHEVLLDLLQQRRARYASRWHLFAVAAQLIRRTLVDRARRRATDKRGVGWVRAELDELALRQPEAHPSLVALDDALSSLEKIDQQAVRIVELRYFAGLSLDETAAALGVSRSTVVRSWRWSRVWLEKQL